MKRVVIIPTLALLFFGSCARFPSPSMSGTQEEEEAYAWFDALGFPDVRGKPYVEVSKWKRGFLIAEDEASFTIFTPNLSETRYSKYEGTPHQPGPFRYRRLDLGTEARKRVEEFHRGGACTFYGGPSFRLVDFVLSWACRKNGLSDVAHDLFIVAANLQTNPEWSPEIGTMKDALARAAAQLRWQDFVFAFADEQLSLKDLLARIVLFNRRFPDGKLAKKTRKAEAILRCMVLEDSKRARTQKSNDDLTKEERIADLIFRLRDQSGHQWTYPGSCDIFGDFWRLGEPAGETPAHALTAIGYDAVPHLVKALEDDRFTRAISSGSSHANNACVLRVGDCVRRIIERISWRRFYNGNHTSWEMVKDGDVEKVRNEVEVWWNDLRMNGEKQALIDDAVKGDEDGDGASARLLKRYPESALDPILRGARKATEPWIRSNYILKAAKIKGDGPVPFLLEELKDGPFIRGRATAAWCLHEHGRPEAVPAMIEAWKGFLSQPRRDDRDAVGSIVRFLVFACRRDTLEALRENFATRSLETRRRIVTSVADIREVEAWLQKKAKDPGEVREGIRRVLFIALKDSEETNLSMSCESGSVRNPRICDLAADALNRLWPFSFPFALTASKQSRDLAIRRMLADTDGKNH